MRTYERCHSRKHTLSITRLLLRFPSLSDRLTWSILASWNDQIEQIQAARDLRGIIRRCFSSCIESSSHSNTQQISFFCSDHSPQSIDCRSAFLLLIPIVVVSSHLLPLSAAPRLFDFSPSMIYCSGGILRRAVCSGKICGGAKRTGIEGFLIENLRSGSPRCVMKCRSSRYRSSIFWLSK